MILAIIAFSGFGCAFLLALAAAYAVRTRRDGWKSDALLALIGAASFVVIGWIVLTIPVAA
jgi:hypothetical protein